MAPLLAASTAHHVPNQERDQRKTGACQCEGDFERGPLFRVFGADFIERFTHIAQRGFFRDPLNPRFQSRRVMPLNEAENVAKRV